MNDQELAYINYVPLLQRLFCICLAFELDKGRQVSEQVLQDLYSENNRLYKA